MKFIGGLLLAALTAGGLTACSDGPGPDTLDPFVVGLDHVASAEVVCEGGWPATVCTGQVELEAGATPADVDALFGALEKASDEAHLNHFLVTSSDGSRTAAFDGWDFKVIDEPAVHTVFTAQVDGLDTLQVQPGSAHGLVHAGAAGSPRLASAVALRSALLAAAPVEEMVVSSGDAFMLAGGAGAPAAPYALAGQAAGLAVREAVVDETTVLLVAERPAEVSAIDKAVRALPSYAAVPVVDVAADGDIEFFDDSVPVASRHVALTIVRAVRSGPGHPEVRGFEGGVWLTVDDYDAVRALRGAVESARPVPRDWSVQWKRRDEDPGGTLEGDVPWEVTDAVAAQSEWENFAWHGRKAPITAYFELVPGVPVARAGTLLRRAGLHGVDELRINYGSRYIDLQLRDGALVGEEPVTLDPDEKRKQKADIAAVVAAWDAAAKN